MLARGKPLSSMDTDDCMAYRDFLADPPKEWCGPRSRERWTPLWRPFEGPLNPRAQGYAIGVLANLYAYLNAKNYLAGNPWQGIHVPTSAKPELDVGRSLTEDQWAFVKGCLARLPATSIHRRLQVALPLLYATGLRLSEVIAASTDDLEWVSLAQPGTGEREEGWWLTVIGKGNKLRRVPVPDTTVHALGEYLESRGFASDPARCRGVALLGHATDQEERAGGWAKIDTAPAEAGLAATTCTGRSSGSSRRARPSWKRSTPEAPRAWRRPARTGCGTPIFPMHWPLAHRSRPSSKTRGTHRLIPPPATSRPRTPAAELQ